MAVEEPPDRTDPRLLLALIEQMGAGSPGRVGLLQATRRVPSVVYAVLWADEVIE